MTSCSRADWLHYKQTLLIKEPFGKTTYDPIQRKASEVKEHIKPSTNKYYLLLLNYSFFQKNLLFTKKIY